MSRRKHDCRRIEYSETCRRAIWQKFTAVPQNDDKHLRNNTCSKAGFFIIAAEKIQTAQISSKYLGRPATQLLQAFSHKMRGPEYNSRWGSWKISSYPVLLPAFRNTGFHSAAKENDYQGVFLGVNCGRRVQLTTPPSKLCRMSKQA
jgi:hypothetical protein